MSTKNLILKTSKSLTGTINTVATEPIPIPVNTCWTDETKSKLSIQIFLILSNTFDIANIVPTCDINESTNTLTIDFSINELESGKGTNPNAIWYLTYQVDFSSSFRGDLTVVTNIQEIKVSAPETKRGTTTTVQH